MKYKCVIWDWNGTLVDDIDLSVKVFNSMMLKSKKREISIEEYRERFKFPIKKFYEELGFDFSKDDFAKVGAFYIDLYNSKRFECNLHEGVEDCLFYLQKKKVNQSILSAYERNHLIDAVRGYKIENYFNNICGLENIYAASKIELGKALVSKLDIDPKKILMIGDTDHDKHTADAMGVDCVLMAKGHNPRNRLESLDVPVFGEYNELLDFLKL